MQYIAISNIKRDGQTIAPGTTLELTDGEAESLLMGASIKPAGTHTAFTIRASAARPAAVFGDLSEPRSTEAEQYPTPNEFKGKNMQYRALQKIQLDGKTINPGELVDLSESDSAQLLNANAIEPAPRRFVREVVVPGTPD